MTLWIANGEVLKSSSQWQFNEFSKLNNSVHELFIFKIFLIKNSSTNIVLDGRYWDFNGISDPLEMCKNSISA